MTRYPPIESHGIIGDLQTVALVGLDGCIDFLCLPSFDSPSVFAALLDHDRGGHFLLQPVLGDPVRQQLYHPDTNALVTRLLSTDGVGEVSDFMAIHDAPHPNRLVRRAKAVRGSVRFRMRCAPRFDYGRGEHTVQAAEGGAIFSSDGLVLRLSTKVRLEIDERDAAAEFTLQQGESVAFVLETVADGSPVQGTDPGYAERSFHETLAYWRKWIRRSTYTGRWREEVHRSALALKLLHSRNSGAVVASPTFGLPEEVGGVRNWDYRYTWIRDASFTVYALIRLGLTDEAGDFIHWLVDQAESSPDPGRLQIVYGIDGRSELTESTLDHFEGYRGSRPVRIGNAAFAQTQLDIYGELLDSLYLYDKHGEATSHDLWARIAELVGWVCKHWKKRDLGIWEVRSEPKHFLYSRLMCWVAVDRGIRLAEKRSFPAPIARWRETRDEIHRDIWENFWDPEAEAFVGDRDSKLLDAACLLMPLVRFVSPTDPRWLSTLRAVEERLVDDALVHRYETNGEETDGIPGAEGGFTMCSFWYVECVSRAGELEKARYFFERMLGYANHLGLYAEELGLRGEHLGNFPQAFTHLALISAAYDLDRRLSDARGDP